MKVLILSMTVGQGHNFASNALKDYLISQGHEANVLDTYKFLNLLIGEGFDKGYNLLGRVFPKLNDTLYTQAEKVSNTGRLKTYFPYMFSDMFKSKMKNYIEKEQPDAIVCTHVFCSVLITQLKDASQLDEKIKTYGILTDYSLHPFWEHAKFDYLVVANELVIDTVAQYGIPKEKILPFGIPVKTAFSHVNDKKEMRRKLGIDENKLVCLLSCGGRGFGALDQLCLQADKLDDVVILAMTGSNLLLRTKIKAMKFKNEVKVYGFVNNMDEFLDAADFIVGKPGGLSTQEALAKGRVMILTPPIPGVEDSNLAFLLNNSLAVHTNKHMPLNDVVMQLTTNEERVDYIRAQIKKWAKPNSAQTLGDFIVDQYNKNE